MSSSSGGSGGGAAADAFLVFFLLTLLPTMMGPLDLPWAARGDFESRKKSPIHFFGSWGSLDRNVD